MHEKIIQFITNLIFMVTILSVCVIKISCSDNFLADLNQGTSVIYWAENNGDGNEEEFLRELRTIQSNLHTSSMKDRLGYDDFLADLNKGSSVIYWSENNGNGNEEEFLRECRALYPTIQKKLLTSSHHHENFVENDSFPEESDQSLQASICPDAYMTDIKNNTTKICFCAIS